jgi:hypothetical protein
LFGHSDLFTVKLSRSEDERICSTNKRKEEKNERAAIKQIALYERETNDRDPGIVILKRGAG